MASNQISESPDGDGSDSRGSSKLDNLSRDDLVKFVKKQMVLLQKSKSQCDALNRELTQTKAELKKHTDSAPDERNSDDDKERETLIEAYNASQSALEESAAKIASLTEQMNCLQQKNETLTSLYQCMQNEYDAVTSRCKELESSNAVLLEARDEAVGRLTEKKQSESYICPNCGERESKLEELTIALTEFQSRVKFLETVEQDRDRLRQDLGSTQEKLAKAAVVVDKLKKERLQLKEQHAEDQASLMSLIDLQQAFDKVKHDKDNADQEKLKALQELDVATGEAGTARQQLEEVVLERDELASQVETLQKTTSEMETHLKAAFGEAETRSQRVKSLQDELLLAEQNNSALQRQISDKEASSCHFAKAFDDISFKYKEVLDKKLEADDELERFFTCLGTICADIKGENLVVNQFGDAKDLLISIKDEYSVIRRELDFQKEANKGLNKELAELKDSKQTMGDESSRTSREIQEHILQIEALKAEVETQTKGKEELSSLNEDLKLTIKHLESRLDQQIGKKDFKRETSLSSNDDLSTLDRKGNEVLKVDREFSRESTELSGEFESNITEKDVLLQEAMFSRGKLAEWETMMSMMQAEKDGLEREITKFGEREARSSDLLEEILRSLQDALKDRDLFHDESKRTEDNGLLYAKLCILQSIVDETNFERDEMREKIQHLSEQVVEMEKRISAPENDSKAQLDLARRELDGNYGGDRSLVDAEKKENYDEATLERSADDSNQVLKSSTDYDEIVEALNAEIAELKQLLEIEKSESQKWKCSSEEKDGLSAKLLVERDLMEKKFFEAREELDNFLLKRQMDTSFADEPNDREKKSATTDLPVENRDSADGVLTKELDSGAAESEKMIMTEQVQMRTVRTNDRSVIEVLSDGEKMHLLEENNLLKEEILSLKQQLSSGKYDGLGLTIQKETSVVGEEINILASNSADISSVQHRDQQAHRGSWEEKSGELLDETGNGDGRSGRGSTAAVETEQLLEECRRLRERLDIQDLELEGKNSEIEKLKSAQSWGWGDAEAPDEENQMEKMQEEFTKNKEELEAVIAARNAEIQRLTSALNDVSEENRRKLYDDETSELRSELSRIQAEMESLRNDKDAKIETLESDLRRNGEEKDAIQALVNALNSELAKLKEDETILVASQRAELEELKKEVNKLREESDKKDIEADDAVSAVKADFAKAMDENSVTISEKEKLIEALELELTRLKESSSNEVNNLEDDFRRVKEDFEAMISVRETQMKELAEKLVLSEEVEDLVRVKEAELEARKEEILALKEEADKQMKLKDYVIEQLEVELSRVREIVEKNAQDGYREAENLKAESIESEKLLSSQIENSEQERRRLEERIDSINEEHSISMKEKDGEIARLTTELAQYREETENITTVKDTEMETLRNEIAKLKTTEHEVGDKLEQIERLRAKLVAANEENEKLRTEKGLEIAKLSGELENSRTQIADLISCGKTESERLQISHDREMAERDFTLQSNEAKIKELEQCIRQLQADVDKSGESNVKLMSLEKEYEAVKVTVNDKENEIERLKDEIAALRNQLDTSFDRKDEPAETQLEKAQIQTSSASPMADLQQQLKDREERENKLKQLTLKAKKESAELKAKLLSCQKDLEVARTKLAEANSTSASNQSVQFQSLQKGYEDLESRFEVEKGSRQELEKNLTKAIEELTNTKVKSAELTEENSKISWELQKLEREKKELETKCAELEQEHYAERIQREQLTKNCAEMESKLLTAEAQVKELEEVSKVELKLLQDQIKTANLELSLAKTEIQQSSMMDLEIADYERAVKSINETVAERNAKIKSLQEDIDRMQEQKTAMQKLLDSSTSQYTQLDDHCNKLKQLLVKSKKDLAEAKKLEGEQRTSDAHLRGQLERLTQLTEEQKLQISSLTVENQRQADKLRLHSDTHQRTAQSLELRVQTLEQDLQLARSELAAVQADYDGYKVRVHSVLKHQKIKSGAGEDLSLEQERSERQLLEKVVDSLKVKLADMSHQMSSVSSEYDQLQEEHDRLQTRNARLITEMETNERNWRDRLEKVSAESSLNSRQKAEAMQQFTLQSETISANYKEQIHSIQEEHRRVVQSLRQQLEGTEIELDRYRARLQAANQNPSGNSSAASALHLLDREASPDRVLDFVKELRPEERQSGEGSENIEDIHAKTTPVANQSLLPFEQLLDSSQMDDVISVKTMESTAEELALKSSLTSAEKRIEHLTQILNESEATVLRLTEQASILKGEIRRMERNQEREQAISNMEYLKNIVYKFLTLKSGDERLQLIPVLTTMLKLSPDEKDKMTAIATGVEGVPPTGQDPSGWGAYLHRWSGLV